MIPPVEDVVLPEEENVQNGTDGDDELIGTSVNDTLYGLAGEDTLRGGAGDDTLNGDEENDAIYGGEGNDHLDGGVGEDNLQGDDGDDLIYGGEGNDRLSSGYTSNGGGYDPNVGNLYGDAGDDVLSGAGLLNGGEGNDTLRAVATVGAESVTVLTGGAGADTFVVGHGFDPDDHGADEAPYLGLYDPVTKTDFQHGNTLVINVPSGYSGGITTYGGGAGLTPHTLEIVIDGPDGNEYVVAVLEGYVGVFDPTPITFVTFELAQTQANLAPDLCD